MARKAKNTFGYDEVKKVTWETKIRRQQFNTIKDVAEELAGFSEEAIEGFGEYHQRLSDLVIREFQKAITVQDLGGLAPLKDSTIAKKKHNLIFLDTKFLIKNISVIVGSKRYTRGTKGTGSRSRALFWYVGPNNVTHPNSGSKKSPKKSLQEVMSIMEYGAPENNQLPRPFFSNKGQDIVFKLLRNTELKFTSRGVIYINRLDQK